MGQATPGSVPRPSGFIFDESGMPEEIQYLGNTSISAAGDQPYVLVADAGRREFGRAPLSSIGTVAGAVVNASPTGTASGIAIAAQGDVSIGLRETGGASALVFFIKTSGGSTLSGAVTLGVVI